MSFEIYDPSPRVTGHGLAHEGAPHDDNGNRIGTRSPWGIGTGGPGRARCACGALSDVLPSAPQRKAWHRHHKTEVTR